MKERLTGAIILVVLIVLLVPELLSGPKGPAASAPAGAAVSSSEEPPLRSYTINLGDDSHSPSEPAGSAAASNGPAMPQPSGPEQPTAQPGAAQSGTSEAAGSPSQSDQLGQSPRSPARGRIHSEVRTPAPKPAAVQKALIADILRHCGEPEASKPTRTAAAEKAVKGRSAAANTASNSEPGGWGVQLGVFASHENAERLALEVRVKGFKASVSPVSSGGRKLYRVRVGPAPDRSAAQELQGKLKAAVRSGGTVVPYS